MIYGNKKSLKDSLKRFIIIKQKRQPINLYRLPLMMLLMNRGIHTKHLTPSLQVK